MNKPQLLTGATVVLGKEVRGNVSVLIANGVILAIDPMSVGDAEVIRLDGKLLMPGLVDLHCDALEKEVEPRPGVHFPVNFACAQADKRNAAAGVTTIYHSLSFANHELGVRNNQFASQLSRAVQSWQPHALVDNRVHARYEVTDDTAVEILTQLMREGHAHLISFMDHTPGQGQFKSTQAYRDFLSKTYDMSESELDKRLQDKITAARGGFGRMEMLAQVAKDCGISIASHDDDTPEKVALIQNLGAVISEFPINLETAQAAKAKGLFTLFGAPNILRGKSQSGSMRALDAVIHGVADCLCGDYSPAALLPAALLLPQLADITLPESVALVTRNPALAAGLNDRGEIVVGKRADLIAVSTVDGMAQVEKVWVAGTLVLNTRFNSNPTTNHFSDTLPESALA
jgi:alpha-D-ribose 1-methylphosphonate 5-triphosphate diphosphatase